MIQTVPPHTHAGMFEPQEQQNCSFQNSSFPSNQFSKSQGLVGLVVGIFWKETAARNMQLPSACWWEWRLPEVHLGLAAARHSWAGRYLDIAAGVQAAAGKCFRKQMSAFAFYMLILSHYWNKQRVTLPRTQEHSQEDLWSISWRRVTPGKACSCRVLGS